MAPSLTLIVKLPSKSVIVPFEVPFSITVAPIIVSPFVSTTVPLISVCAHMTVLTDRRTKLRKSFFSFSIVEFDKVCTVMN